MTPALALLALLAAAPAPLAAPAAALPLDRMDLEGEPEVEAPAPVEENPWNAYLLAPMPVPWPLNLCLAGWAPWGRSAWVKDITGAGFLSLGVALLALFPCSFLFTAFMLAASVVVAVLAVLAFVSSGLRDGCCPSGRTVSRGGEAAMDVGNVWTWALCLSFVVCTPWMGFKLAQRGWLALSTPLPEPRDPGRAPGPSRRGRRSAR